MASTNAVPLSFDHRQGGGNAHQLREDGYGWLCIHAALVLTMAACIFFALFSFCV
jgi:hypothetical protein